MTSTTAEHREELLKWFSRMTDSERLDVLQLQIALIRTLAGKGIKPSPEVSLATLVEALFKRSLSLNMLTRRPQEGAPNEDAKRLMKMRIDSLKREKGEGKKERAYRLKLHGVVCDLREKGLSWRQCAEYLRKFHRGFRISHQRLSDLHKKYAGESNE